MTIRTQTRKRRKNSHQGKIRDTKTQVEDSIGQKPLPGITNTKKSI